MSPSGDDSAEGTYISPYRTLSRALEAARESGGDINEICMRGGVYSISETINVDFSGNWYDPLVIRSFGDEEVVLNAGYDICLSDMSEADPSFTDKIIDKPAAGKVLQYDLKAAGITDYGEISRRGHLISENKEAQAELSLGGSVQKLAGWPNDGFTGLIKPQAGSEEYGTRTKEGIANGCSFAVDYDRPSLWSAQDEVWLSGTLGPNYEFDYYPVSRFDSDEKRVYLREGALVEYYTDPYYRFENIPEELDAPGEYYIDRDNGILYYYPPEDTPENAVLTLTMPTPSDENESVNSLLRFDNCSNISFEGMTFMGGRGSAVSGRYNSGISFKDCDIHSFGENGIRLDFSDRITVRGCRIHDVGQDGVQFSNCGDYLNMVPNFIMVCSNDIYNFARLERSYKTGINFGYRCVGATAARNHVHDGPHSGMIFYGVNNDIYGNEFNDLVTEFSDMDAVYANNSCYPWERGNRIHGNYFHDIGNCSMNGKHQINVRAIRTDNKGCGLNIYGNLFYRIGDEGSGTGANNGIGAITAEGTRNKIIGNLFVDCTEAYSNTQKYRVIEPAADGTLYADTDVINGVAVSVLKEQMQGYLPVYGKAFPELYNFFYEHPNMSRTNEFKNNMVINIAIPLSSYNGAQDPEGYRGAEELVYASGNYVSDEDPGFTSYADGNFEFSQGASLPVDQFPNIRMDSFGIIEK